MSKHHQGARQKVRTGRMESMRNELFTDIIDHLQRLMVDDYGMVADAGEQVGVSVVEFLSTHWAGITFSIPGDYYYKLAKRDLEMYRSHYGKHRGDFSETAKEWGLTDRGVRKVISRVAKRLVQENQGSLFDEKEEAEESDENT